MKKLKQTPVPGNMAENIHSHIE